jgi:putative polyhydroxyalkanoate system protein
MANIDITRAHKLPIDDAKKKAEELAKSMQTKLGMTWKWSGNTIVFEAPSGAAKGTKGDVVVTAESVRVTVDLPFMLRMMKGTIESKIHEKLDQIL